MSNGINPAEQIMLQLLDQEVTTTASDFNPAEVIIRDLLAQQMMAPSPEAPELGIGASIASFFKSNFLFPETVEGADPLQAASAQGISQLVGLLAPTLSGIQAIAQIPGIFTKRDIPTDKAADFIGRLRDNLTTAAEKNALDAGLSPQAIADSYLYGEMIGYTIPVVASLKTARLVRGIQGPITGLARNFELDTIAGGIFGALLTPGETLQDRAVNTLRESAIFGVGGLMLNGVVFGIAGMRFSRLRAHAGDESLDGVLRRIQNGEQVIIKEAEGLSLVQLMNEEGFLANSPEAHALLANFEFEASVVAGVRNAAEAGQTRGFVQNIGNNFTDIGKLLPRIQEQFPALKFDVIGRDIPLTTGGTRRTFDLHFGMKGLNNNQKSQLAREGRFAGQIIEKGGTTYEYVRPAKGDRLVVKTADGKTTTIEAAGVSNRPYGNEEIILPTAGQALYEDYRSFTFERMGKAAGVEGAPVEEVIIKRMRDGTLTLDDAARRQFDVGGAITHPEELGISVVGQAEEFTQAFLREGKVAGDLLEPVPIRKLDDGFDAWMASRGLNLDSTDIEAFRQNFAQRLRDDIWALVPEEDMAIFRKIRDETNALIDEKGLTFIQRAHAKGFHTEGLPEARMAIRDINTGARLEFGSEKFASDFVDNVVRSEKDPFGLFLSPGPHGMPALTGGFGPNENIFTFEVNGSVASKEFLTDLPFAFFQNRRDFFLKIEDISGMPLFTKGFGPLDEAITRMNNRLEPIGRRIQAAWKGLNREQRIEVAEFWTAIEGEPLTGTALTRAARAAGLNNKQITAFTKSRTLFDFGAQQMGLEESRYIPVYYSRLRPEYAKGGEVDIRRLLSNDPIALKEFEFWAEMNRTGDLANIEMDPEIVMHKYFRSLFFKQEVAPIEIEVRKMMDTQIRDLSLSNQSEVLRRALPKTTKDSFVLPEEVRSVLQEYLTNIRGDSSPGFASMRRFMTRLFKMLDMDADPKLFDEMHSTYLSLQYGAALGIRPAIANRNAVQNLWMMYTRLGGKHGTTSLRRAMSLSGFDEAVEAQAVRPVQASVPQHDAIYEAFLAGEPITGNGPVSNALASATRHLIRLGRVSRRVSQKMLIPYGSGDQVNRAWAYWWQKLHTLEKLADFDAGKIDWATFLDEGLPFFSSSIKKDFRNRFDKFGREAAVRWIGKQAADEAHFIYAAASSPTWMQRPFGRLLGVFGQWPLWAIELYARRMAHGTPKQVGQFWARTLALTGAFANMTVQTGIDMWSWVAPTSLIYGGGPFTQVLVDLKNVADSPLDRRAAALKRLTRNVGSLALPGQIFYSEFSRAMKQDDPMQAALMIGLGRPVDQGNFAYDFIINPGVLPASPDQPRIEGLPSLDELLRTR